MQLQQELLDDLRSEATDGLNYRSHGSQGLLAKTPKAALFL